MVSNTEGEFLNLHEFIKAARLKLNSYIWDYLIGGAETETAVARNRLALDSLALRPRVLVDVSQTDASWEMFGKKIRLPVCLAPVGSLESFEDGGGASVSSESELTIPGTNPDTQCPAVLPGTPQNPLIVYFSPISPKLSPAAKSSIARMVNANAFTRVTCAATTQGDRTIKWLANERAKAVCNYVKSLKPRMKTKVSVGKPGIQASHRAVLLTGS